MAPLATPLQDALLSSPSKFPRSSDTCQAKEEQQLPYHTDRLEHIRWFGGCCSPLSGSYQACRRELRSKAHLPCHHSIAPAFPTDLRAKSRCASTSSSYLPGSQAADEARICQRETDPGKIMLKVD